MNWKDLGLGWLQRYAADILASFFAGQLEQIPEDKLNRWLVNLGVAFGPPGLRHFSVLSPEEQAELLARVPVLTTTHTDWLKPFQRIKRTTTVWLGAPPRVSDIRAGEIQDYSLAVDENGVLLPIPRNGDWYVLMGYMASTTAEGVHNRLGWRYDNIDSYWTLSVSVKRVN